MLAIAVEQRRELLLEAGLHRLRVLAQQIVGKEAEDVAVVVQAVGHGDRPVPDGDVERALVGERTPMWIGRPPGATSSDSA